MNDSLLLQIFDFIRVTPEGSERLEKTETNFSLDNIWPQIAERVERENAIERLIRDGYVTVSPTRFHGGTVLYQLTPEGYEKASELRDRR